jgi:two-component system, OmpR family, response regulator RstA
MDLLHKQESSTYEVENISERIESLERNRSRSDIDLFYLTFMHDSIRDLFGQTDKSATNCYKKETKFLKRVVDNNQSDTITASTCAERTTMQTRAINHQKAAKHLLFLSDHDDINPPVKVLEEEGYIIRHLYCPQFESGLLKSLQIEAVLIDLNMPTIESISICQTIRSEYDGPILFVTAPSNDFIQLMALEMGADDFLFKPQPEALLLTKIRTLLRRSDRMTLDKKTSISLGELQIDAGRREVQCSGKDVLLTDREFDLLWYLAKNARNILSRDEIHQSLYKREYNGYDRSIDIYISRIRQKIGDDPHNPRYLKTIRGAGYLLVENHA